MKKIYLLFIIIICTMVNRSAAQQPGYVITRDNDTIKCIVRDDFFGPPKYQAHQNNDFKEIVTDSIREYQATNDSSVYLLEYLHDHLKFIQWAERGKINLYIEKIKHYRYLPLPSPLMTAAATIYLSSTPSTYYYLSKDSAILQVFPDDDLDLRTLFMSLISDNLPLLIAFRQQDDVTFDNIRSYIKRYNQAAQTAGK